MAYHQFNGGALITASQSVFLYFHGGCVYVVYSTVVRVAKVSYHLVTVLAVWH